EHQPFDGGVRAGRRGPGQPDEVRERHAVGVHVDAQPAVLGDGVAAQQVAPAGDRLDPVVAVGGDEVGFPDTQTADDVGAGPVADHHAAARIGGDEVAPHGVPAGAGAPEHDAVAPVGGDEVALLDASAPDEGSGGPPGHLHAVEVAQGDGAAGVGADHVALHG